MRAPSLMLGLLLLGGCAVGRDIDAPSLGQRVVEKQTIPLPDEAYEPQVALDQALAARISTIEAAARDGHAAFEAARARTAAAVARASGTAIGSESWTAAQQELSALEGTRGPVGAAAGEIDALRQDPANAASGNRAAIEAAANRIEALSQAEADAVIALSGQLKS